MKEKLRNEIARKLYRMDNNLADSEKVRKRWEFIDKFILCEVAVKKVMRAYREGKKGESAKGYERLNMGIISKAVDWAGYGITKPELEELFSGSGKYTLRGSKSAKKLRDGMMHEHNENDIQEVVDRFEELNEKMDAFLAHFRWTEAEMKTRKKKENAPEPAAVG